MRTPRNYQVPYTSSSLLDHMAQSTTTLCVCLKVTAMGGSVLGFTSNTRDMTLPGHPGVTFKASSGLLPASLSFDTVNVPDLGLDVLLSSAGVTEADYLSGKWRHAILEVMLVNWVTPGMGELVFKYRVGETKLRGQLVTIEGRGLSAATISNVCDLTSPTCRANLYDSDCGVDPVSYTRAGTVTTGATQTTFRAAALSAPTVGYAEGIVTFTAGDNNGFSMEVKSFDNATKEIVLKMALPYTIDVGDTFSVKEGCLKDLATCKLFGNAINMQAEPHVPQIEKAYNVPPVAGQ